MNKKEKLNKKDLETKKEINLNSIELDENTENLVEEKRSNNNLKKRKKLLIFSIIFGVVIIGLAVILILNGQKTASIAKELELGEKYLEEGLYEEAKLAFDKVIEIDKKEVKGYEGKAEVAIILKEYSEAEVLLQESTVIKETDEGQILMAEVYINTERKEEGKTLLNEVKNNGMENLKTVEKAAKLYNQLQEYNMTIELLEERILKTQNKEELKKLYDALIDVYIKAGKSEEEIVALLERAAKAIEDPSYIDKKDEILVKIPSFSLVPGEYSETQDLKFIKGQENDKLYYTIDGTEPTEKSKLYESPLSLPPGEITIKVVGINPQGRKSKVVEGKYIIKINPEEVFKKNIEGVWVSKVPWGNSDVAYGEYTCTFTNSSIQIIRLIYNDGKTPNILAQKGQSSEYTIVSVNETGTSGVILIKDHFPEDLLNSQEVPIDCGVLGDGIMMIYGKNYDYKGDN